MRDDPLPQDALPGLLGAVGRLAWSHGPLPPLVKADYRFLVRFFWHTGAHPAVLARTPEEIAVLGPRVRRGETADVVEWRRPKTRRFCKMPVPRDLAAELEEYLARPQRYSTRHMQRIFLDVGREAGVDGPLTPRRLRHTVGYWLTVKQGPGVAKDSLGVSDRVLQDYTRRMDERSVEAVAEAWMRPAEGGVRD